MQATLAIRYCKPEDYTDFIRLTKKSVDKVLPDEEYEQDKLTDIFQQALSNEEFTVICLEIDKTVQGYIIGYITEHYFHSKKIAYCMSIFVEEEYRGYGLEMLRAFEAWGKYKGAQTLSISTFNGLSPEKLGTVYKRLGFKEKEISYWKEV